MSPSISVIIPTYNRLGYIHEALDSVLAQSVAVDEILVVDDGSTDGTEAVVAAMPTPVRYIRQKNAGPSAARNRGLREAKGDWIALLDSDDLWLPDKLRLQQSFLEKNPGTDFIFGNQVNLKEGVREAAPEILNEKVYRRLQAGGAAVPDFFSLLLQSNPIPTSSVMFRRSCLAQVGGFDEQRWRCEDYDLWFRFARHYQVGFLEDVLVAKRSQHDNLINDYMKLWEAHLDVLQALPKQLPGMNSKTRSEWECAIAETIYRLASFQLSRGERESARRWFSELRTFDLPPLSKAQVFGLAKKALISLGLERLAPRRPANR